MFRCITYFIDLIKEHLNAYIDVNESYLKKLPRDHAPSVMQNARKANTLKSYRTYSSKWKRWTERFQEVKLLPAEDKYVGVYLLDLITQGETLNIINIPWFAVKAYHKFCGYNICDSFFCLSIYEVVIKSLQSPHVIYCRCISFSRVKVRLIYIDQAIGFTLAN